MITLDDILKATNGQLHTPPHATSFTNFSFDSRLTQPNELFLAVKTERGDGHDYIHDAFSKGATGTLCVTPPTIATSEEKTIIVVDNTQAALQRWGRYILCKYDTEVIGVTGSTGKTTTKEVIAHLLSGSYSAFKNPGNWNGRYGLPLALGQLRPEQTLAVLEMASDSRGEIADLVAMAPPKIGVVTTVQPTHLETFGDLETIAQEKADLVRGLPAEGIAFLNADDKRVRAMQKLTEAKTFLFGFAPDADLVASKVEITLQGTSFTLHLAPPFSDNPCTYRLSTPLLGHHTIYPVLAAIGIARLHHIPMTQIQARLTTLERVPGRLTLLQGLNGSLILDDSYNASPAAMHAALEVLAHLPAQRRLAILGDMAELGELRVTAHTNIGKKAANILDKLVTKGESARLIAQGAKEAGLPASQIALTYTTDDAIQAIYDDLGLGTIILVKGGMTTRLERVSARLLAHPEDQAKLVRQNEAWQQISTWHLNRPTWLQINLEAIAHNTRQIRKIVGTSVKIMAIMKADAYGHGAVKAAQTALNNGASWLGVACLPEAECLRQSGIHVPILILGYTPPWQARTSLRYDLRTTLFSLDVARALSKAAVALDCQARVHIKVDTGMHRLGLFPDEVLPFIHQIRHLPNLVIEGLFTHFSVADTTEEWYRHYTLEQLQKFQTLLSDLQDAAIHIPLIHAANSAATLAWPDAHFNMVRPGIALYGIAPSPDIPLPNFQPALTWKTQIAQVKTLPPNAYISYGATYRTTQEQRIAIIPVGYADGFRRAPATWSNVLVRGQRAPIVGRVCMDQTMIDVTNVPKVRQGDEVVLIGEQEMDRITVEEVAERLGTIPYEVVSEILARVPRVG